jgi:hypothetical protein
MLQCPSLVKRNNFSEGPIYNGHHSRRKQERDNRKKPREIHFTKSHLRRGEPLLHHNLHPTPTPPLSIAIDSTCTLDPVRIGGILRPFGIDFNNLYAMFITVDLYMGEGWG